MTSHLAVGWLGAVHLVHSNNELLHTEGVGQECVLSRLPVFADSGLKLSRARCHDKNSTVSLTSLKKMQIFILGG